MRPAGPAIAIVGPSARPTARCRGRDPACGPLEDVFVLLTGEEAEHEKTGTRRHRRRHEPRGRQLPHVLEGDHLLERARAGHLSAGVRLGLGATIVDRVGGLEYVEFVGTGMVATAVIFSSAFPAMFGTFVKERFQRTYDAILAAPVDVEELVTAEMLGIALRAGFYGCFPLIVAMLFGLDPAPGMLLVPFFCFFTALGFAAFGIAVAASVPKIDSFNYVTTLVITPLFLVAGTFFPIDQLPEGFQAAAQLNPLHHLVELVRGSAFGFEWTDLIRSGGADRCSRSRHGAWR